MVPFVVTVFLILLWCVATAEKCYLQHSCGELTCIVTVIIFGDYQPGASKVINNHEKPCKKIVGTTYQQLPWSISLVPHGNHQANHWICSIYAITRKFGGEKC